MLSLALPHIIIVGLQAVLPLTALSLLIYAAFTDICRRKIYNWVSLALLAIFCVFAISVDRDVEIWIHLAWGGVALMTLLPVFALGKIGGGDVKLLASTIVWCGPVIGVEFLILTTLIGGGIALISLSPTLRFVWDWGLVRLGLPGSILIFPAPDSVPYGVAIAAAGCFVISKTYLL